MQENFKETFIKAIRSKNKIRLIFYSRQDKRNLIRVCAPMDFGPSRNANNQDDRFHVWDYESDKKPHSLCVSPKRVRNVEILDEQFQPSEFVTWSPIKWHISRDWGDEYS